MSGGREAPRVRGRSVGRAPLRSMRSMAARRLTAALTGAQPPHGGVGGRCGRLPLQSEERLGGGLGEPPAGVAQPHLVGREQQDAAGLRPLGEPPETLGEARPIGGRPLPDNGYGVSSGRITAASIGMARYHWKRMG